MKRITGKYGSAKIFATKIDEATKNQITTLLDQPFTKGIKIRIMPDCHAGMGCVIGTTMMIKDKVVPNLVGVDIGCGMLCACLGSGKIDLKALDNFIRKEIPSGREVNKVNTNIMDDAKTPFIDLSKLKCYDDLKNIDRINMSLGSLGGGNHFIEIDKSADGNFYLVIHSGSRNLGKQVAEIYQDKAVKYHESKLLDKNKAIKEAIEECKRDGRVNEIPNEVKKIKERIVELDMPKELCYLEGDDLKDYLHDIAICQEFANLNRHYICWKIIEFLNNKIDRRLIFTTAHNYINNNILRKGSISAFKGELVIIPINMRDGSIIGVGKGCRDYNYSAPHGAGRLMSRSQARKELKVKDFKETMKGIYSTSVSRETIDESPSAYKPIEDIINNISKTIEIVEIIKPVYNFKASEEYEKKDN